MLTAAWTGAALFAASLVYFGYFYLVVLGRAADVPASDLPRAMVVNVALFTAFALHHSVFARTGVKRRIARALPPPFERSAYVWLASALFLVVCVLWQPLPGVAWQVEGAARLLLYAFQAGGLVLTLASASRIDVWELSGIQQVRPPHLTPPPTRPTPHTGDTSAGARPTALSGTPLEVGGPYRWLRHPLYLGWVLFVCMTPTMTLGRLMFATISTTYLVVAIPLEERSLIGEFGQPYRDYQRQVRWRLLPGIW